MIATGFEPVTVCLEGRCSIQLSYATKNKKGDEKAHPLVGVPGFEPGISWSQTRRHNRTSHTPLKRGLNPYFLFQLASDRYQKASAKITIMLFSASTGKKKHFDITQVE